MERWAKVQNTQKESAASSSVTPFKKPLAPMSAVVKSKESAAADAGFAVLSKVVLIIVYWLLWSPYGIGQTIIFSSCRLFCLLLSFFFFLA